MSRFVAALVLLVLGRAEAFGVIASKVAGRHHSAGAELVVLRDGELTVLTIRQEIIGPKEPVALVLPVPNTIELASAVALGQGVLEELDELDAPRLEQWWEADPCNSMGTGTFGVGFARGPRSAGLGPYRLEVVERSKVAARLAASGLAITNEATAELEQLPEGHQLVIAELDPQKVELERGVLKPAPLRLQYRAPKLELPIRLGAIDDAQDVIVHVITAEGRVSVAELPSIEAPTNVDLRPAGADRFGAVYAALVARALERVPLAVITEFAGSLIVPCDGCRFERVVSPYTLDELGFDLVAKPPPFVKPIFVVTNARELRPGVERDLGVHLERAAKALEQVAAQEARGGGLVLTRLRFHLARGAAPRMVSFVHASPIVGGREVWSEEGGVLEVGASPATFNSFQTRFIERHGFTGRPDCEEPAWGEWGDHPKGAEHGRAGEVRAFLRRPALPPPAKAVESLLESRLLSLGLALTRPPPGTSRHDKRAK